VWRVQGTLAVQLAQCEECRTVWRVQGTLAVQLAWSQACMACDPDVTLKT
jgi:hypothetical protein